MLGPIDVVGYAFRVSWNQPPVNAVIDGDQTGVGSRIGFISTDTSGNDILLLSRNYGPTKAWFPNGG